jgi:hypothetical protein
MVDRKCRCYEVPFTERRRASGLLLLLCSMPSLVTNHSPPALRVGELDRGSVVLSLIDDNQGAARLSSGS